MTPKPSHRNMREEYLSLVREYHQDMEGLREANVSQSERDLVAKDYDATLTTMRESMGVGDSEAEQR